MIGRVGDDPFGRELVRSLEGFGVDVAGVKSDAACTTGVALIGVEASGENRIVVVPGANARLTASDLELPEEGDGWVHAGALLLQCEIPWETILAAAERGRSHGMTVILDPAPPISLPDAIWPLVDICMPNQIEAEALTGGAAPDLDGAKRAGRALVDRGVGTVIVKLGRDGALLLRRDDAVYVPGIPVTAVDTTAAGDVFAGGLAVALTEGRPLLQAVTFANAAAALSTTRRGAQTSIPTRDEVDRLIAETTARGVTSYAR
jgi:ribokinase